MKKLLKPSCSPSLPMIDSETLARIVANLELHQTVPLNELFEMQPIETFYSSADKLSLKQISGVPDTVFDEFVRLRPPAVIRLMPDKISRLHIEYLVQQHPWNIIVHGPQLLDDKQIQTCIKLYPDMMIAFASKCLHPDDLLYLFDLFENEFLSCYDSLLENAHKFSPHHFRSLILNPNSGELIAEILDDENLCKGATVIQRAFEASEMLTDSERSDAAPTIGAIMKAISARI